MGFGMGSGESAKEMVPSELDQVEDYFFLEDGRALKSIADLKRALTDMDPYVFYHHVTPTRNDFSKWIRDVLLHEKLADALETTETFAEFSNTLNSFYPDGHASASSSASSSPVSSSKSSLASSSVSSSRSSSSSYPAGSGKVYDDDDVYYRGGNGGDSVKEMAQTAAQIAARDDDDDEDEMEEDDHNHKHRLDLRSSSSSSSPGVHKHNTVHGKQGKDDKKKKRTFSWIKRIFVRRSASSDDALSTESSQSPRSAQSAQSVPSSLASSLASLSESSSPSSVSQMISQSVPQSVPQSVSPQSAQFPQQQPSMQQAVLQPPVSQPPVSQPSSSIPSVSPQISPQPVSQQYTPSRPVVSPQNPFAVKNERMGIQGFDELLPEGLPAGSAILLSGGPGTGKTTFSLCTLGWACKAGQKCLYLSFEEDIDRLRAHMIEFGFDVVKFEKEGLLIIKKMDSFDLSRSAEALLAKASGELLIELDEIEGIIPSGFTPDRIVIDSLSAVAAAFWGRPESYRVYLEQLFALFKKHNALSFFISEIEQSTKRYSRSGVEEFLADAVFVFYNLRHKSIRVSACEIIKVRGVPHSKKIVPFKLTRGKGMVIYPQEDILSTV